LNSGFTAKALAKRLENVDFPTPPLPDNTRYFFFTDANFPAITDIAIIRQLNKSPQEDRIL
jgi:hypothetical protein